MLKIASNTSYFSISIKANLLTNLQHHIMVNQVHHTGHIIQVSSQYNQETAISFTSIFNY